jgi:uncharacterized protein
MNARGADDESDGEDKDECRLLSFPEFCPWRGPHSMTVSMYKVSVPIFVQFLTAQSECIDKAIAHIEAKQLDPNFFLNMRLFPDMYPYARQVQQASTHAARCCSALAGTEMPNMPNTETSFAELKARLAKTIDYCKTFKPAQIDGTEDKDITIKLGANERKFTGQGLLQNFILPNFYFHCTTAYDILRHCGVELSKRDFMSTPVNL